MDIAEIDIRLETRFRDESGRFLTEVHEGGERAMEELADHIAARAIVNFASRTRARTGALLNSIKSRSMGLVGEAYLDLGIAPHGAPQEGGAGPHPIPNAFGWGITVDHPGNPAVRAMRDAGQGAAAIGLGLLRVHMPG